MSSMVRAFDRVFVDRVFRKNSRDETIYYPFGLFGKGYRAPEDRLAGLQQATRRLWLITLVVTVSLIVLLRSLEIPGGKPLGWLIFGGSFALLIGGIAYLQSRLAADLERE